MKKIAAAVMLVLALSACGGNSADPADQEPVTSSGKPTTDVVVLTDWVKVEGVYSNSYSYFRTIQVGENCFVEEFHERRSNIALASTPCPGSSR